MAEKVKPTKIELVVEKVEKGMGEVIIDTVPTYKDYLNSQYKEEGWENKMTNTFGHIDDDETLIQVRYHFKKTPVGVIDFKVPLSDPDKEAITASLIKSIESKATKYLPKFIPKKSFSSGKKSIKVNECLIFELTL